MRGRDALGLGHPKYPVDLFIETAPATKDGGALIAGGSFDCEDTFGRSFRRARKCLLSGKFYSWRFHAHWSPQTAGKKICPLEKLRAKLPEYERLAQEMSDLKVGALYVSHSCEYRNTSEKDIVARVKLIEKFAPSCIPVNCPDPGYPVFGNALVERHGASARSNGIISTDGHSAYDINILNWFLRGAADLRLVWGLRDNLAENKDPDDPFIPPLQRKAIPSREYLESLNALLFNPEPPPTVAFTSIPFAKPLLYKTHAEDSQGVEDPRENKPLVMLPQKDSYVMLIDKHKDSVCTFPYWQPYPGGVYRYYSGLPGGPKLYGYQIAAKAKAQSGSPWVWFKFPEKPEIYGPVHPSFRAGYFQK